MTELDELKSEMAVERERRLVFLKSATPRQVLEWIMRAPDVDPSVQAYCAKALIEADDRAAKSVEKK